MSTSSSPFQFRHHPPRWLLQRVRHPWRLAFLFAGIEAPLGLVARLADDVLDQETLRFDVPILLGLHARSTLARRPLSTIFSALDVSRRFRRHGDQRDSGWNLALETSTAARLRLLDADDVRRGFAQCGDQTIFPSGAPKVSAALLFLLWPGRGRTGFLPRTVLVICAW